MMTENRAIRLESREGLLLLHQMLSTCVTLLGQLVHPEGDAPAGSASEASTLPHRSNKKNSSPKNNGTDTAGLGALLEAPIKPDGSYSLQRVAQFLGKSVPTIRKKVIAGTIEAEKRGPGKGQFFVKGSEVIRHSSRIDINS